MIRDPSNTQADLRQAMDRIGYPWVTSHVFRKPSPPGSTTRDSASGKYPTNSATPGPRRRSTSTSAAAPSLPPTAPRRWIRSSTPKPVDGSFLVRSGSTDAGFRCRGGPRRTRTDNPRKRIHDHGISGLCLRLCHHARPHQPRHAHEMTSFRVRMVSRHQGQWPRHGAGHDGEMAPTQCCDSPTPSHSARAPRPRPPCSQRQVGVPRDELSGVRTADLRQVDRNPSPAASSPPRRIRGRPASPSTCS